MNLNNNLAYLAGAIIGDGHLYKGNKSKNSPYKDYRIHIETINKEYTSLLLDYIKTIIKTKTSVKKRIDKRTNRKIRYYIQVRNKQLYKFLSEELKIPIGKKSGKVNIPDEILKNKIYSEWFIAGLYDTDGGKRGHTIGFTTKSKKLIDQTSLLLNKFKISHLKEKWNNQKYNKDYYGIRLHKKSIDTFLKKFPLQNKSKKRECQSGQMGQA